MPSCAQTLDEPGRTLAPAHECPWCRSLDVEAILALTERADDRAKGRCGGCGRDVVLVPAGHAC